MANISSRTPYEKPVTNFKNAIKNNIEYLKGNSKSLLENYHMGGNSNRHDKQHQFPNSSQVCIKKYDQSRGDEFNHRDEDENCNGYRESNRGSG